MKKLLSFIVLLFLPFSHALAQYTGLSWVIPPNFIPTNAVNSIGGGAGFSQYWTEGTSGAGGTGESICEFTWNGGDLNFPALGFLSGTGPSSPNGPFNYWELYVLRKVGASFVEVSRVVNTPANTGAWPGAIFYFPDAGTYRIRLVTLNGAVMRFADRVQVNQYATQAPVALTPSSSTILAGSSVTFTASGGGGLGQFNWGGAASGIGSSKTIIFQNLGSYSVTVYRDKFSGFHQSNTATATITVNPTPVIFSAAPTNFTYDGTNKAPAITKSPTGATYSVSGTTNATNAGSYSMTLTANGNYTGSLVVNWAIAQAPQVITFLNPDAKTSGTSFTINPTVSSGLPITVSVISGSATISGSTVTLPSTEMITLRASQSGNQNYLPAPNVDVVFNAIGFQPAPTVSMTFGVNGAVIVNTIALPPDDKAAWFTPSPQASKEFIVKP